MTKNVPNFNPSKENDPFSGQRQIIRTYLSDFVFTSGIVRIEAQADDGTLEVVPVLEHVTTTGEVLKNTTEDRIFGIKPFYPVGAGCEISYPVAVGDFGLLIACKLDISDFIETHAPAPVASSRLFDEANGLFIPIDFFAEKKTGIKIIRTTENGTDSATFDDAGVTISHTGQKSATITLSDSGVSITTDGDLSVSAENATVTANAVNLGGTGGQPVARVGDTVLVNGVQGSIQSGSNTVKAI